MLRLAAILSRKRLLGLGMRAAVKDRDPRRVLGQHQRFVERGVAAADHADLPPGEQRAVAGGALRYALAAELALARNAQRPQGRAGRDDERAGAQAFGAAAHDAMRARELDRLDGVEHELGAGGLGLLVQQRTELMAADALREARPVLDTFGVDDLAAHADAVEHHHA